MKTKNPAILKRWLLAMAGVLVCAALIAVGFTLYANDQSSKIPGLSFEDALAYTTRDTKDAVITVGIIKEGKAEYTVYGNNAEILPNKLHSYEIGSITKTITASLLSKAMEEGRISLDETIDTYLSLPKGKTYPTVEQLLTHTSGYKAYYLEAPMISNFFAGRNGFCGVTKEMVMERVSRIDADGKDHPFVYSNFGFAVLGLILESAYAQEYTSLMNRYLQDDLRLTRSKISDGHGDLGHYWDWQEGDAYIPAGAVISNISDMLTYAQHQLNAAGYMKQCHTGRKGIDAPAERLKSMGIHMEEIGMAWVIDKENNIIWHNGATSHYNSYLGFNPGSQTAVVVLSNLAPDYRIPATVLGATILRSLQ